MLSFNKSSMLFEKYNNRHERHGDKNVPRMDLFFKIETGAGIMEKINPEAQFFREWRSGDNVDLIQNGKVPEQPCVVADPTRVYPQKWIDVWPGYTLQIERGGNGDESALVFEDVKLADVAVTPKDGPIVVVTFRLTIDAKGVVETVWEHFREEVVITLSPPTADPKQQELAAA